MHHRLPLEEDPAKPLSELHGLLLTSLVGRTLTTASTTQLHPSALGHRQPCLSPLTDPTSLKLCEGRHLVDGQFALGGGGIHVWEVGKEQTAATIAFCLLNEGRDQLHVSG